MQKKKLPPRIIIAIDDEGVHFSKTLYVHINAVHNQVEYSAKRLFTIKSSELKEQLRDVFKKRQQYKSQRNTVLKLKKKFKHSVPGARIKAINRQLHIGRKRKKK